MRTGRRRELSFQNAHRAQARGPKVLQRSAESATPRAARTLQISFWARLMSAPRIASDDFEADMHLDSAGASFGAPARGGWRRRVLGVGEK